MYNLPERTQENMETKIDPLTMENIVKINLSKSTGASDSFTSKLFHFSEENLIFMLFVLFQDIKKKGNISVLFLKLTITQTPPPPFDKYNLKKRKHKKKVS